MFLLYIGRLFLSTSRALVNVYTRKLALQVDDMEVHFDIQISMRYPPEHDNSLCFVDVFRHPVRDHFIEFTTHEAIDTQLSSYCVKMPDFDYLKSIVFHTLVETEPPTATKVTNISTPPAVETLNTEF